MRLTAAQRTAVARFLAVRKFGPERDDVGFSSQNGVADFEAALNASAKHAVARPAPKRIDFLDEAEATLDRFALAVIEDRERAARQVGRVKQTAALAAFEGRFSAFQHLDAGSDGGR